MNLPTEQPRHWAKGPSSAERRGKCLGSVLEAAKYPAKPSGKYAIDGTHSHTLLEKSLTELRDPGLALRLGCV